MESTPAGSSAIIHGVWAASAEDVFAVGDGGLILRRTNDVWTQMASGTTANLRGVHGLSSTDVWVGGTSKTVLHFDGTSWTQVSGATADCDSVFVAGTSDVWFAGGTAVQRWTGSGFTTYGFGGTLLSISGTGPNDVWATGEASNVRRWNGQSWSSLSAGVGSSLMSVLAVAPGDVWVTDFMPNKQSVRWNGTSWVAKTTGGGVFNGMSALAPNDIWGVGTNKIGHWNGSGWTLESPLGSTAKLWSVTTRPGHAWAVGSDGLVAHRSL